MANNKSSWCKLVGSAYPDDKGAPKRLYRLWKCMEFLEGKISRDLVPSTEEEKVARAISLANGMLLRNKKMSLSGFAGLIKKLDAARTEDGEIQDRTGTSVL